MIHNSLKIVLLVYVMVGFAELTLAAYKRVCYYTNWAQYRNEPYKYFPEDVDPTLCTHVIYAFAKLNNLNIQAFEWNDESTAWSTGMYARIMALKGQNPNLKILLAIGGWNLGTAPFTKIVATDEDIYTFANNAISFLRERNFDGLDLDWEYPGNRGSPPEDKGRFTKLVEILRLQFEQEAATSNRERLLLTAAVAAGKGTIDSAYEISRIAARVDFINLMAYDLHGSWDGFTGHNSPLFARSDEQGEQRQLNQDWAVNYWLDNGAPKDKLILGIGTYGRSFTLSNAANNGYGVVTRAGGNAGQYTREAGFISYYEVCLNGCTTVWNDEHKVPFAYNGDQWVGYDDVKSVKIKANYIKSKGLGGAMFWALDLDDFDGTACNQGRYPLMSAVKNELLLDETVITTLAPAPTIAPAPAPTLAPQPTQDIGIVTPKPSGDGQTRIKIVCYFTSWAKDRPYPMGYNVNNIDPFLCTHIIFAFARVDGNFIVAYKDSDEQMYSELVQLKLRNPSLKVLLAIGGWSHGTEPFTAMVSSDSNIDIFAHNAINFLRARGFDGLDLDWEYPANRGSPPEDKNRFSKLVSTLKHRFTEEAIQTGKPQLLLTAAVAAGKWTVETSYDIGVISLYLDFINLMSYDLHGSWESFLGHNSPLYSRSDESGSQAALNQDWAVSYWLDNGTPPEKLVLGIATYGRSFRLLNENQYTMGSPSAGAGDAGVYTKEMGFLAFYEVCDKIKSGWKEEWNSQQKVPFAYGNGQWVGFDDQDSVKIKANYLKDRRLGGAMFWTIDLDDFNNHCGLGKYPLINQVKDILLTADTSPTTCPTPVKAGPAGFYKVCYFDNHSQYRDRPFSFTASDVDATLCTHIVYNYAKIDGYDIHPTEINDLGDNGQYMKIMRLRQVQPSLKILLGIKADSSLPFRQMTEYLDTMETFTVNTLLYIRKYDFDGVDLQWEYPSNPDEMTKFSALVKMLREVFDLDAQVLLRRSLIISAKVPPLRESVLAGYDVPIISKSLDFVNLVSYDFNDNFDAIYHHSPLYKSSFNQEPEGHNVASAVKVWLDAGLPKDKLVVGIPFYGNTYKVPTGNHLIGDTAVGIGLPGEWTLKEGILSYFEICLKVASGGKSELDVIQGVPHAYSGDQWVGYDDSYSVELKTKYVLAENLRGIMVDDISMDDFSNVCMGGAFPLLSKINQVLTTASAYIPPTNIPPTTQSKSTTTTTLQPTTPQPTTTQRTTTQTIKTTVMTKSPVLTCGIDGPIPCKHGGYYADTCDRAVFYQCVWGRPVKKTCSWPLVWNQDGLRCDWSR